MSQIELYVENSVDGLKTLIEEAPLNNTVLEHMNREQLIAIKELIGKQISATEEKVSLLEGGEVYYLDKLLELQKMIYSKLQGYQEEALPQAVIQRQQPKTAAEGREGAAAIQRQQPGDGAVIENAKRACAKGCVIG